MPQNASLRSPPKLSLPQLLQQQVLQRRSRRNRPKTNAPPPTKTRQPLNISVCGRLITAQTIFAKGHFLRRARLRIHKLQVPKRRRTNLLLRQNLNRHHLTTARQQRLDPRLISRMTQKIAQHHHRPSVNRLQCAPLQILVEIRQTARRQRRQILQQTQRRLPPAHTPQRQLQTPILPPLWKHPNRRPIQPAKRHITHRRRNLPSKQKLRRLPESHRLAGIQKNRHRQLPLLFVKPQKKPIQTPIQTPVQTPKIIPRHITPIIRKLNRMAAGAASSLPTQRTLRPTPRHQLQPLQPPQQIHTQQSSLHLSPAIIPNPRPIVQPILLSRKLNRAQVEASDCLHRFCFLIPPFPNNLPKWNTLSDFNSFFGKKFLLC